MAMPAFHSIITRRLIRDVTINPRAMSYVGASSDIVVPQTVPSLMVTHMYHGLSPFMSAYPIFFRLWAWWDIALGPHPHSNQLLPDRSSLYTQPHTQHPLGSRLISIITACLHLSAPWNCMCAHWCSLLPFFFAVYSFFFVASSSFLFLCSSFHPLFLDFRSFLFSFSCAACLVFASFSLNSPSTRYSSELSHYELPLKLVSLGLVWDLDSRLALPCSFAPVLPWASGNREETDVILGLDDAGRENVLLGSTAEGACRRKQRRHCDCIHSLLRIPLVQH